MYQWKYWSRTTIVFTACLFMACVVGCGDDEAEASDEVTGDVDTVEQQTSHVTPCHPDPPYDTCHEVDLDQLVYWQDDLQDPDWRDVAASSDPEIDYEVTIDAHQLNGGVIPTQRGQGHYINDNDYHQTLIDLLGVDPFANVVTVRVANSSVKFTRDEEPTNASTGDFIQDATTNDDGEIWIDGVDRTDDFVDPNRHHGYVQQEDSSGSSSGSSSVDYDPDDAGTMSSGFIEDTVDLDNGQGWEAEGRISYVAAKNNLIIPEVVNIRKDGIQCLWTWYWDGSSFTKVAYMCYHATKISIETETQYGDGTTFLLELGNSAPITNDATSFAVHYFSQPTGRACSRLFFTPPDNSQSDDGFVKTDAVPTWSDCNYLYP